MSQVNDATRNVVKEAAANQIEKQQQNLEQATAAKQEVIQKALEALKDAVETVIGDYETSGEAQASAGSAGSDLRVNQLVDSSKGLANALASTTSMPELDKTEMVKEVVGALKVKLRHILPEKALQMFSEDEPHKALKTLLTAVHKHLDGTANAGGSDGPFVFYMSASSQCTQALLELVDELTKLTNQLKEISCSQGNLIGTVGTSQATEQYNDTYNDSQKEQAQSTAALITGIVSACIVAGTAMHLGSNYSSMSGTRSAAAERAMNGLVKIRGDMNLTEDVAAGERLEPNAVGDKTADEIQAMRGKLGNISKGEAADIRELLTKDSIESLSQETTLGRFRKLLKSVGLCKEVPRSKPFIQFKDAEEGSGIKLSQLFNGDEGSVDSLDDEARGKIIDHLTKSAKFTADSARGTEQAASARVTALTTVTQVVGQATNSITNFTAQQAMSTQSVEQAEARKLATLYRSTGEIANQAASRSEQSHSSNWSAINAVLAKISQIGMGMSA